MTILIRILLLFLTTIYFVYPATFISVSPEYTDVSNAVQLANAGDTVLIPPGTATWTNYFYLRRSVNLIGAGTNSTFITNCIPITGIWSSGLHPFFFLVDLTNGNYVRFSGIFFDCYTNEGLWLEGGYTASVKWINPYRIDHCVFYRAEANSIKVNGPLTYGVVDHCLFLNCHYVGDYTADFYSTELTNFTAPYFGLGSTNARVTESCNIIHTQSRAGLPQEAFLISCSYASDYVFRYNFVSNSFLLTMQDMFDAHGNGACDGTYRGTIWVEIYSNIFYIASDAYRMANFRGGTVMFFSNQLNCATEGNAGITLDEEEAWNSVIATACGGVVTNWPRMDQITNSFFWNNTHDGTNLNKISENAQLYAYITNFFIENRDYYFHSPWQTPYTNGSGALNAMTSYQPLVYPHPLVTSQDGIVHAQFLGKANFLGKATIR